PGLRMTSGPGSTASAPDASSIPRHGRGVTSSDPDSYSPRMGTGLDSSGSKMGSGMSARGAASRLVDTFTSKDTADSGSKHSSGSARSAALSSDFAPRPVDTLRDVVTDPIGKARGASGTAHTAGSSIGASGGRYDTGSTSSGSGSILGS